MEKSKEQIVQEMQEVVEQMRLDDLEECPEMADDYFDCDCCAKSVPLAGSVEYAKNTRLCNDCVLFAEIGFALKKFNNVQDLLDAMEDKRLETLCEYVKQEQSKQEN